MARRSPTNPRYAKYTGPEGKTRKSAAAAKPKKASSSGAKASSAKSSSGSKPARSSALAMRNPTTPEFKAVRRQWWIALVVGLVLTAVSYALQAYVHTAWSRTAQASILGMAYVAIGYAFYIDWKKMRPMRREAYELQRSGKAPKPTPDKPSKAEVKAEKKRDTETTTNGSDAD